MPPTNRLRKKRPNRDRSTPRTPKQRQEKDAEFSKKLQHGLAGEKAVAQWLAKNGHIVFHTAQFKADHAPYAIGREGQLVFTDFVVSAGKGLWLGECKRGKWHDIGGKRYAGFSYSALKSYKRLGRRTGVGVMVYFLMEGGPAGLYCADLARMPQPTMITYYDKEWAVWPASLLRRLAPYSDVIGGA